MATAKDIQALLESGRKAWPALAVDPEAFGAHVERLAERHGLAPSLEHAGDLYLAYVCAIDARGALAAFDARYGGVLTRSAARAADSDGGADEAVQRLRLKLFVDVPPRILEYGGRARLSTWLATAAARSALNAVAPAVGRRSEPLKAAGRMLARANPEIDYARARFASEFEPAIVAALEKLSERERAVLRLHLGQQMSIDDLAKVYAVGRSTTARWLAGAREALLSGVRRELRERLGLTASDLRSIGRDLESKLQVSLVKLL